MEHSKLVSEDELGEFADRRESQSLIPELISELVRASIPTSELSDCRIPYGSSIGQPGLDGYVETARGFLSFVPTGQSYWEIGTGASPIDKATADFNLRTEQTTSEERAKTAFVFVTPRSGGAAGWNEPSQRRWRDKRQSSGWREIRVIDGHRLAEWLREFPSIGRWLSAKIGLTTRDSGFRTPFEHWKYLRKLPDRAGPRFESFGFFV